MGKAELRVNQSCKTVLHEVTLHPEKAGEKICTQGLDNSGNIEGILNALFAPRAGPFRGRVLGGRDCKPEGGMDCKRELNFTRSRVSTCPRGHTAAVRTPPQGPRAMGWVSEERGPPTAEAGTPGGLGHPAARFLTGTSGSDGWRVRQELHMPSVLLPHGHADHIGGLDRIYDVLQAPVR